MTLKAKGILYLILCILFWGPAYLLIKIAVPEIPPPLLVLGRVAIGFLILYPICLWQKRTFNLKRQYKHYILLGILLNIIPFYLVGYAELHISSSLTGVLYSLVLIFTAILGHFFGVRDPLTKNKILGIILGVLGLLTIYIPLIFQENKQDAIGVLLVIIACSSTSIGAVYANAHLQKMSVIVLLTAQLGFATLILIPIILLFGSPFDLPLPSLQASLAVFGLGIITAVALLAYFRTMQIAGSTYASLSVLGIPILAIILGALILHEQLTWNFLVGTVLILSGIFTVNPTKRTSS